MGVIIGNRGFFPDQLAKSGREEMIQALAKAGMDCVVLGPEDSKHGAVETHEEAKRCAALFQKESATGSTASSSRCRISATSAPLPTPCAWPGSTFPVLVQATPDDAAKMTILHRRDSFCGKMSACNNLRQYGIPYSLTRLHTVSPGLSKISRTTWRGLRRCAASRTACAICAWAASARVRPHSTPFATAKKCSSARHLHRDAGSVGSFRPHRQVER